MNLAGARALVTGANRGIGRALVERLSELPLHSVLAGVRSVESFEDLLPPPGGAHAVRAVHMDLSSRESIEECCEQLGGELSQIDLLVNNAGLMTGGLLEEQAIEEVYAMFQVNLVAVAHLTQRVLPGMLKRRRGTIVNNASISGYAHFPAASTYAASKAGVVALTESLRRELRGTGVHAMHLVTPGVATDMLSATDDVYGRHMDTSGWDRVAPEEWAAKVVSAIEADRRVLGPGGRSELARLAAGGPTFVLDAITARLFSRRPRR
ncbi:MAG TPA: SDR family NAD(P)-dependent oxidoreductase [Solirubrobacteraceae bacterium]|jgi:short-subunit dehydrogenase|nr:SDR family NAD(P)-dependent oxidoreductase [Solirubrobacteraceae bacterium]